MPSRAIRRHHLRRMKAEARRVVSTWGASSRALANDPSFIGRAAAVHCRWCSCFLCQYGKDIPPPRERAALATNPTLDCTQ
jgi:hypothetical protein